MSKTESRDTDARTVKLSEVEKYLTHHFNHKRPVMVWGPPGIGKSELIEGIKNNYKNPAPGTRGKGRRTEEDGSVTHFVKNALVDVRLPLWEPTDIKGIPYYNSTENNMTWAPPAELPSEKFAAQYDTVILFLDELNGAAPAVQAAAYQLILNRRVGTYRLPDNVVMVAAGNRETDKGVTYRMPKPLANRFVHYEIRVSFDDWVIWATDNGISPDVVGYLTYKKKDLYAFDPKSNDRSFPTPRSWSFVSELLQDAGAFSNEEITDMVSGAVGEGAAIQFNAHREIASSLPNPSDILTGEVKELRTTKISAKYSLSTSLAYELKTQYDDIGRVIKGSHGKKDTTLSEKDFVVMMDNTVRFMMDNFEPEMIIMSIRVLFTQYKISTNLRDMKCWPEFMKEYGDMIKQA